MPVGLLVIIVILAIIIVYFFGFTILWWCILIGVGIFLLVVIHALMETEGIFIKIGRWLKKTWPKYLTLEAKFFKWIDNIFK